MTDKITLKISSFDTPSLKGLSYAILQAGPEMIHLGDRREAFLALRKCIAELASRANQGDISEIIEMHDHWLRRGNPLKPAYRGNRAAEGTRSARDR